MAKTDRERWHELRGKYVVIKLAEDERVAELARYYAEAEETDDYVQADAYSEAANEWRADDLTELLAAVGEYLAAEQ